MSEYTDRLLKFIIVGNSGVGKSCLLMRYADNTFTTAFYSTIGVDFKLKNTNIDGKRIKLQIWDTAGQDRYRTITSSYYKNAHAVMLVYDISNKDSFESLKFWQQEAEKYGSQNMIMMVLGNKTDRQAHRQVKVEEAKEYANSNNFEFFEVSALSDKNIAEAFECMARLVLKKIQEKEIPSEKKIVVSSKPLEPEIKTGNGNGQVGQSNGGTKKGQVGCSC